MTKEDPAAAIGERLAAHRARRGTKVSALAREIGVSPSLISQIERGQSRPSVSTLFALAEALDVPVDAFFRNGEQAASAPQDRYAVRRADRAVIDVEGGVRWERLTPTALDEVDFMELAYVPGAEAGSTSRSASTATSWSRETASRSPRRCRIATPIRARRTPAR
jgi:transcriptional regulator with XRE-family HTH domain